MIAEATAQDEKNNSDEVKRLFDLAPRILKKAQDNNTVPSAYLDMLYVMAEIRDLSGFYHRHFHGWNRTLQRSAKAGLKKVGLKDSAVG